MSHLSSGAAYYGQCAVEPLIPVFLIVAGVCGIVKSVETLFKQLVVCCKCSCLSTWSRHPKLKYLLIIWRVVDVLFNLALFAWFIAGSVWVFRVYSQLQADPSLCNPVLYKCSFGIMICSYILLGLTCCCVCGCACCRQQPSSEEEERDGEHQFPECEEEERRDETACSSPSIGDGVPLASSQQELDRSPEEPEEPEEPQSYSSPPPPPPFPLDHNHSTVHSFHNPVTTEV